jgi:hypothetical protein
LERNVAYVLGLFGFDSDVNQNTAEMAVAVPPDRVLSAG